MNRTLQVKLKIWVIKHSIAIVLAIVCEKSFSQEIFKSSIESDRLNNIGGIAAGDYLIIKTNGELGKSPAFLVNPRQQLFRPFSLPTTSPHVVGWQSNDEEVTLYYSVGDPEVGTRTSLVTFSKAEQKFVDKVIKETEGPEKFLSYVNFNDTFHRVLLSTDSQQMIVRTYSKDTMVGSVGFFIDDEKLFKHIKKEKFTFIEDFAEVPFDDVADQNKMYARQNILYLVIDRWKDGGDMGTILICNFDMATSNFRTRTLRLTTDSRTEHNSFLFGPNLYVLATDDDFISINVYDIATLDRIGRTQYVKGQKLEMKNSFLVKDGKNVDQGWEGKWKDDMISNYTFKFITGGTPVISVSSADDTYYRFLIGNYKIPGDRGVTPGSVTVRTPGTIPIEVMRHGSVVHKSYFYGYLSKDKFVPPAEKITTHGEFSQIRKRRAKLENEIKLGGTGMINARQGAFFIYVDRETKTLYIEQFK